MKNRDLPERVRCVIYTRKSTFKGLEQQYNSLEAQEDRCKSFIDIHEAQGWMYTATYSDAGISGGTTQRPALQRMIEDARKKKFDMVIVFKLDRLARNQRDFLNLLENLSKNGVEVASATEPFDSASYLGRAMRNLLGVFAEMEREMISERTREKIAASCRKGLYLVGKPPLGYVRVDSRLKIIPEEAAIVRFMFEEYAESQSCYAVADKLTQNNIRRTRRDGSTEEWTAKTVHRVLRNVLYGGFVALGDERFPGQHEAIVKRPLWNQVQKILDAAGTMMKERVRKKKRSKLHYPLLGLMRCGKCGKLMQGTYACKNGISYRYYTCRTRRALGEAACGCPHLNAEEMENFVRGSMTHLQNNNEFIAAVISRLPDAPAGKVSDCIFNLERLLNYGRPAEMEAIYKQVFETISFDWVHEKVDFKYRDLS